MASLFKRPRSPYWWIKFREGSTVRRESTLFRIGHGPDTRRARELQAERTLAERQSSSLSESERWEAWVPTFLTTQYASRILTRDRYLAAWRSLRLYLEEKKIHGPRQLSYEQCRGYFAWRACPDTKAGKYKAGVNTAHVEMRLLSYLLKTAVRRGFCSGNPCMDLGVPAAPRREFPDYTDADLKMITEGIAQEPPEKRAFLWPSFWIALHHGVRLRETNVRLADVSLESSTITFHQKRARIRTKPLHPAVRAWLETLQQQGQGTASGTRGGTTERVFPAPPHFAQEWNTFLKRCGLKALKPNACFHSLRVTVQNRLRRAKVPKEIRMAYLSHETKRDVNAMYDRIELEEMRVCHAALSFPFLTKPAP